MINKLTNKNGYPKYISFEGLEKNPSEIPSINNISRNKDFPEEINEDTNFDISNNENQEDVNKLPQNVNEVEEEIKSKIPKSISPKSPTKYEYPEVVEPTSSKAIEEPLPSENVEDPLLSENVEEPIPSENYEEPVSNNPEIPPEVTSSIPDQN